MSIMWEYTPPYRLMWYQIKKVAGNKRAYAVEVTNYEGNEECIVGLTEELTEIDYPTIKAAHEAIEKVIHAPNRNIMWQAKKNKYTTY